jgi:ERCC4-related helicase
VQDKDKHYGSIVYIDTGAGKTYIALMMIKEVFGEGEEIKMLTEKQI